MIDSTAMQSANDVATSSHVPPGWVRQFYFETAPRFRDRSERIQFTAAVRNEELVVPIPDPLISDEDVNFVAYIAPERRTLESHIRQTLEANEPIYTRSVYGGRESDETNSDWIEAFAAGLYAQLVDFGTIIGKLTEDGEKATILQYSLDYLLALPDPSDRITPDEWKKLPAADQDDWSEVRLSGGRVSYRRYKQQYWRDAEGRKLSDPYYRKYSDDGEKAEFKRNELATRRAWREHKKALAEGQLPLEVRHIPALDVAPVLVRGTKKQRWECRGLVIRNRFEESNLLAQGLAWFDTKGVLVQRGYNADRTTGRFVDLYEAHVWLENDETGQMDPCVIYEIDGARETYSCGNDGNLGPAVINLREQYGLDFLPVHYGHGAHSTADDPDLYGFPVMEPMLALILNMEDNRTSFNVHHRKYAYSKLAVQLNDKISPSTYLLADGSPKKLDVNADMIYLPGPVGPMIAPPSPEGVHELDQMYQQALATNTPSAPDSNTDASGHSLTVQGGYFKAANGHILEGAREEVEWIGTTAMKMLAALEEKHKIRASVQPADEIPADAHPSIQKKAIIEFDSRWFKGNYQIKAVYPKVGNLAEIQQEADLKERGLSTFRRVMEKKGVQSVFNERVEVAADQWWESDQGKKFLELEALKRRGDAERVQMLEAQIKGDMQPNGLPTAAIPPEIMALQQQMQQQGGMAPGGPPVGAQPMPGMQLPNIAGSALGGAVAGAVGTAQLQSNSNALTGIPGGGVPGAV